MLSLIKIIHTVKGKQVMFLFFTLLYFFSPKTSYSQNEAGNELTEVWIDTAYFENTRISREFFTDTSGNCYVAIEHNLHAINDTAWLETGRTYFHYDDLFILQKKVSFLLDSITNAFIENEKILYTYNNNHLVYTITTQNWQNDEWQNSNYVTYSYTSDDLIQSITTKFWDPFTGQWEDSNKQVFTYDSQNNIILTTYQFWTGTNWMSFFKEEREYSDGRITTETGYHYDNLEWVNYYLKLFHYTDNQLDYFVDYDYDESLAEWSPTFISYITYYSDNASIFQLEKMIYSKPNHSFQPNTLVTYLEHCQNIIPYAPFEEQDTVPSKLAETALSFSLFPNPGTSLKIYFQHELSERMTITIHDTSGKLYFQGGIYCNSGPQIIDVDALHWPHGAYVVKIDGLVLHESKVWIHR